MFSKYIYNKSKFLILMKDFSKLNKLLERLKIKNKKISFLFWYLDNEVKCCSKTWERVYRVFDQKCILFPIKINQIIPKALP